MVQYYSWTLSDARLSLAPLELFVLNCIENWFLCTKANMLISLDVTYWNVSYHLPIYIAWEPHWTPDKEKYPSDSVHIQ